MRPGLSRRHLLALAAAAAALGPRGAAARDDPIQIDWIDLIPEGDRGLAMRALQSLGIVQHGELSTPWNQDTAANLTTDYDGKRVRLPGYIIPLDFVGMGVTDFLLVPYVGACIHVPPPPPNQLVFVTTEAPYEVSGLFEPVWVTGEFGAAASETELAEVGYAIAADAIEPYED